MKKALIIAIMAAALVGLLYVSLEDRRSPGVPEEVTIQNAERIIRETRLAENEREWAEGESFLEAVALIATSTSRVILGPNCVAVPSSVAIKNGESVVFVNAASSTQKVSFLGEVHPIAREDGIAVEVDLERLPAIVPFRCPGVGVMAGGVYVSAI